MSKKFASKQSRDCRSKLDAARKLQTIKNVRTQGGKVCRLQSMERENYSLIFLFFTKHNV